MSYENLSVECIDGNIYVITMKKAPENRINIKFAQELIRAYRDIEKKLGPDSEGAVITRGNDAKFWCTVSLAARCTLPHHDAKSNIDS
jgi:hypothetical protein